MKENRKFGLAHRKAVSEEYASFPNYINITLHIGTLLLCTYQRRFLFDLVQSFLMGSISDSILSTKLSRRKVLYVTYPGCKISTLYSFSCDVSFCFNQVAVTIGIFLVDEVTRIQMLGTTRYLLGCSECIFAEIFMS